MLSSQLNSGVNIRILANGYVIKDEDLIALREDLLYRTEGKSDVFGANVQKNAVFDRSLTVH